MVSANLKGGLGNQMFQISAAVSIALENNDEFGFDFNKCFTPNQGKPSKFYTNNIFKNIKNITNYNFSNFYSEPFFSYEKIYHSNNLLIDGYFQSEKYFKPNLDFIKNLFHLENIPSDTNDIVTSVHIRRGDYQKFSNYHNLLDMEYYQSAINKIGVGKFIFFSDDMEWVKSNFSSPNFIYSESQNEIEDFYRMTSCNNNIIGNSSFSWWAAYLNKNSNKIIISPSHKKWFGPDGPKDTQDLIPESWIQI